MNPPAEERSLLVVEPHPAMPGLEAALPGWQVRTARGLLQALVSLARRPAVALLVHNDLLPEGRAPLQEVRRIHPALVILATAPSPCQVPGADDTLLVPCPPQDLAAALERQLELRRSQHTVAELRAENERLKAHVAAQGGQLALFEATWARLGQTISDLTSLLKTVLELFRETSAAERLSLMLLEGNGPKVLRIAQAYGLSDRIVADTRLHPGEGIAGWVAQHGRPLMTRQVIASDGAADPAQGVGTLAPPGDVQSRGYKSDSFLSLPLKVGDEVLGVVNLTERPENRPFDEREVKHLAFLADQAAIWIRHARRFETAERLSLLDELTALYNRRYFISALARELDRAQRTAQSLSLAILDIDHFKLYNDAHGHQAGDELLRQFATVLQKNVRSIDVLCRYGGEEFAVILPKTGSGSDYLRPDGAHFIDRLRLVISNFPFPGLESQPEGRLTISAGVAVFPDDGATPSELIALADERLYRAKADGRNRVCASRPPAVIPPPGRDEPAAKSKQSKRR